MKQLKSTFKALFSVISAVAALSFSVSTVSLYQAQADCGGCKCKKSKVDKESASTDGSAEKTTAKECACKKNKKKADNPT